MKIAVIGAGLMGRAATFDASRAEGVSSVGVFDIDPALAQQVSQKYGNGEMVSGQLDASNEEAAKKILADYDAAISCVTYRLNPTLTRAAIASKCNLVDLGGNNDTVRDQLAMDDHARAMGVTIVPDCGLAPGMVAVLAADAVSRFDSCDSIRIRVGGLPQSPRAPLNYQMVFSAEGLINEYWESCLILEGGRKKVVQPMTETEELQFDGIGDLEAFYTSGGTSTLPDTFEGKIDFLDYKTIRYPGHCKLFRPMLELGLASRKPVNVAGNQIEPREVFKAVLDQNLAFGDLDLVLVRLTATGTKDGQMKKVIYEIVDRQESKTSLTAMMRTTAFPASIVAWMAAAGQITTRGVQPQERCVNPSLFIGHLRKRGIQLTIQEA